MGKLLLECALFACILWQVYILATGANGYSAPSLKDSPSSHYMSQDKPSHYNTAALHQQLDNVTVTNRRPSAAAYSPYRVGPYAYDIDNMKVMAKQEAQRILSTGDYQSLQRRIEKNSFLLELSGY